MHDSAVSPTEQPFPFIRGRGRPATITLAVVQDVARLIAKGLTEEQACLRVGVNHASLRTARHRHAEYETAIKEAQADYLDESLDIIGKGGRGWQGRAWILERRHGDQFRRNTAMELSGHLLAVNPVDILTRKPLAQWTAEDLEHSVGAWKLLKQWEPAQLSALYDLYCRCWGLMDEWTTEKLEWAAEIEKRLGLVAGDKGGEIECPTAPLLLVETTEASPHFGSESHAPTLS